MNLKNGFSKCLLFVLSANGRKDQKMASSFSENPNMEKALFFIGQSWYSMMSKQSIG